MLTRVACAALLVVTSAAGLAHAQLINDSEAKDQTKTFKKWWDKDLEWKFDELPTAGKVPDYRIPYSGYIYPDNAGGTVAAMRKYDRAFHGGRGRATGYEQWDSSAHKVATSVTRRGLFGRGSSRTTYAVPHWSGHCNGWTAAAIRHAEPQKSVTRNGVTFTPSDIKGLLAEAYIYTDTEHLGGVNYVINPATLHVVLCNWLGRQKHPVAMETHPGSEVWNFPIYSYKLTSNKYGNRVDVRMEATYANMIEREQDKATPNTAKKHFSYQLYLDDEGRITGGHYYRGSAQLDMLWTAPRLKPTAKEGNKRGNPHLDIDKILAIWRDSVPAELADKWVNIDVDSDTPDTVAAAEEATDGEVATDEAVATTEGDDANE